MKFLLQENDRVQAMRDRNPKDLYSDVGTIVYLDHTHARVVWDSYDPTWENVRDLKWVGAK